MSDTTTLAKLSVPDADGETDIGAPVVRPDESPPAAASSAQPIAIGVVVRRGVQVFVVVTAAFVVFGLWLSGLAHARSQIGLQRKFRSELALNSAPVGGAIPKGEPIAIVQVRGIGLREVVVEGSRSGQLREGPGHVVGTPLPGQPGNAVIAARRTLYGGPFRHLRSLHTGDSILVTTGEGNTTYRVSHVGRLGVGDGSFVQNRGDNRLTLFTTDSPWTASRRLVVTATLVGNPLPPTALPGALDADGLGLNGERSAVPNMLVWLELLAGAGLLAAFAASRWSRSRVWLVFAPLLGLLTWLFFESFVRLLPATL